MATNRRTAPKQSRKKSAVVGNRRARHGRDLLHELQVYQEELSAQNDALSEAQSALEETRDRFIELYDFAPNGYLTFDQHGLILQINLTSALWLGRNKAAIEGMPLHQFVAHAHRERVVDYLRRCRSHKTGDDAVGVIVKLHAPGADREVQLLCKPRLRVNAGREFFTAMIDVTEQLSHAAARDESARVQAALAGRLISIQEEERHRIARDLHDNIGQQVAGLRLTLARMSMTGDADDLRRCLAEAQTAVDEIDRSLDFIAADLRPAALDLGFASALRQFVREWSSNFRIAVELHVGNLRGLRILPDAETHLYRITQEALNNVYKHSSATAVSIILERRSDRLVLILEDNGAGFEDHPEAAVRHRGFGLVGIRERAVLMNGSAEIESAPGKGTTVFVQIPNAFRAAAPRVEARSVSRPT